MANQPVEECRQRLCKRGSNRIGKCVDLGECFGEAVRNLHIATVQFFQ